MGNHTFLSGGKDPSGQHQERRMIMNNRFKRSLAMLLAMIMLLSCVPTSVIALDTQEPPAVLEPAAEIPTEPVVENAGDPTEPMEPVENPTDPGEVPTEPTEEPTGPVTENTDDPTEPMEPVEDPTDPEEVPTEPTEEPTEPEQTLPLEAPVGDGAENTAEAPVFRFDGYKTLEDFGISSPAPFSLRRSAAASSYLNPQTIRPTSSLYGHQWIANRPGYRYPFTASFTLDAAYMPQNSVYIAIANYDCDEYGNNNSREYDQVYINGHCVGVLTGNDNTTNTTLLKVDRAYLKAGTNNITIRVGIEVRAGGSRYWGDPVGTVHADDPYSQWWLRVDDIQVLCDGGSQEGRPDIFRVDLDRAEITGNKVNCYVNTLVEDSKNRTFSLEYALYDWSSEESTTYGQIIDDDFAKLSEGNYSHEGTLSMPTGSLSGMYTAVVYLKTRENGRDTILAYDEETFEYETGIAPSFDIHNFKAVPSTMEWTSKPVTLDLSADIDMNAGLSDLTFRIGEGMQAKAAVDNQGHVTGKLVLYRNGFYTVELHYVKDGKAYRKTTTVEINNITGNPEKQANILQAGYLNGGRYSTANTATYTGKHTFWATATPGATEIYVYLNNKAQNGGKALTDVEELSDGTLRCKVTLNIPEGRHTISFRNADGSSKADVQFCGITDTPDTAAYAGSKGIELRNWPSAGRSSAGTLPLNATVQVRGEIDITGSEGYDFVRYNNKNYFVKKGLLTSGVNEEEFRQFVKTVSDTYYRDKAYDYNKYYYLASEVKADWDKGGFFGSRKDNAYSTYDKDSEHNIQQVQAMLVDGIQQKADCVTINLSDYTAGLGFNPVTGNWEVNNRAVIAQNQYNADLEAAVQQAATSLTMTLTNTLADAGIIYFGKGKVPEEVHVILNIVTSAIEDGINAYTKAAHKNVTALLQNNYRELMKQAILDMYVNIDQQMSSDYRAMYLELGKKGKLSEEEQLLKDQLQLLIIALDGQQLAMKKNTPEEIRKACDEAALSLVNSIGLEEHPYLSDQQIAFYVVEEVTVSIVLNIVDELIPVQGIGPSYVKDLIKDNLDAALEEALVDLNGDGVFGVDELVTATMGSLGCLVKKEHFEKLFINLYEKTVAGSKEDLQKLLETLNEKLAGLRGEKKEYEKIISQRKADGKKVTAKEKHVDKLNKKIKKTDAQKTEVETKIKNQNLVAVLVDDIIQLTSDTLAMAKASVGIGDMADNEVFFAYTANYMFHAMEAAEFRRDSLDTGAYKKMTSHSHIDDAQISELKNFVNRVYGVYEQDLVGHSAYTTLVAGWHYAESGQKLADWLRAKEQIQQDIKNNMGGWTWISYATGYQGLLAITANLGGISQSEYLEKLNKKHIEVGKAGSWQGYSFTDTKGGFPSVSRAESIYDKIGTYAGKVRIPEQFQAFN